MIRSIAVGAIVLTTITTSSVIGARANAYPRPASFATSSGQRGPGTEAKGYVRPLPLAQGAKIVAIPLAKGPLKARMSLPARTAAALRLYPLTSHLHARVQRHYGHRAAASMVNGPLLVVDQQGERSGQVQIGAGHDEILAVQGGAIRVVAKGLIATCCGLGRLAPSPHGRYIAFSQEPKGQDKPPTEGL